MALSEHHNTLREISIFEDITVAASFGQLRGLQHMLCLIRLYIPYEILLKPDFSVTLAERLPPSIAELDIVMRKRSRGTGVFFTRFQSECAKGRFPALKQMQVLCRVEDCPKGVRFDVATSRRYVLYMLHVKSILTW